jgi:hypothetical protein
LISIGKEKTRIQQEASHQKLSRRYDQKYSKEAFRA